MARMKMARKDLVTFIETVGQNDEGEPILLDHIHRAWICIQPTMVARAPRLDLRPPIESGLSRARSSPRSPPGSSA